MKSVIVYASIHHGNTRKVVEALKSAYDIDTIDAISSYDLIPNEPVSFTGLMEDLFDHIGQFLIEGIPDRPSCP